MCGEGSTYASGYSLRGPRRTAENIMTKFGLMRYRKVRSFWRKTLRNETAQLSDLKRLRLQVYPFCFDVSLNFKEWLKTFYAFKFFSLKVLKFDLYLLKQNIFRALKRDLERGYLMIVGQSLHFASCFWRCNLCTAIFHRRV